MNRIQTALPFLPLPILIAAALWALGSCVPFEVFSYGAWTGILLILLALAACLKPSNWLWMPTRGWAVLGLCAGAAITWGALAWPPSLEKAAGSRQRLDDFLPEYQAVEYHEARTDAPAARVAEAIRRTTLEDMPAALVLMKLRALAGGGNRLAIPTRRPLLDMMLQPGSGFLALDENDVRERVYGLVGTPWKNAPPPAVGSAASFLAFREPGAVRVAFNFKVTEEAGGGVRLSTETRILGTDPAARREFARYWRLIYPGSAIIRQVWLDAIVRRAERSRP